MSKSFRWRASALALCCCVSTAAFAADGVQVHPKSLPLAGLDGKAAVKPATGRMPSPSLFAIKGKLDEHGHVAAECEEIANPKFRELRSVDRDGGGVVKEQQQ